MKPLASLILLGALGLGLSGCNTLENAGLVSRPLTYRLTATVEGGAVDVQPGQTVTAQVLVGRSGIAAQTPVRLGSDAAVNGDPTLLAAFDGGRVTVRGTGEAFTSAQTTVTVSAAPGAAPGVYAIDGARAYLRLDREDLRFALIGTVRVGP